MLGHLIRKEILDQLLSLRFIILSAIAASAIWLSLYDGFGYYQDRVRDFRAAQTMTEERLQFLVEDKSFFDLRKKGFLEHKPPTPLCIFIRGLDPFLGRSISSAENQDFQMTGSPVELEPLTGVFPPLDLGLVVQFILGLFVLLLTYDAVSGEKERGTLRLTASFSIPHFKLLLGKLLGALIPILTVFGLSLLLGIGVILASPQVALSVQEWQRLLAIVIAVGLYLTTLTSAGLFVSSLSSRSSTSFILLLTFWVATVVVMPRMSLIAAEATQTVPSLREWEEKVEALWSTIEFKNPHYEEWNKENPDWRLTPEGREVRQIIEWERREEERSNLKIVTERMDEWFGNRYQARLQFATRLARFSPAFTFHNGTVRLAGAGIDRDQRFKDAFKRDFLLVLGHWLYTSEHIDGLREVYSAKYGPPIRDFSDMPRFTYREAWPKKELLEASFDLGILIVWGLVFFTAAYVAMVRYDPR